MVFQIIVFSFGNCVDRSDLIGDRSYDEVTLVGMNRMFTRWTRARWTAAASRRPTPPPPPPSSPEIRSGQLNEENPSVQISSGLLVQADEGIPSPVVDLIDDIYRSLP
ncbi:putative receptor-like protein kinase [Dorcoceras hygrometricum]|uniref:Putative receptor-like protein kinase n=1 Tax=Dorcoceras hygrometricum TaxID=472368 RepID=A0A2Z7A242_9LAMI|nr:putative receptor-like protein kinase [Dorcoceras hygrometricum]